MSVEPRLCDRGRWRRCSTDDDDDGLDKQLHVRDREPRCWPPYAHQPSVPAFFCVVPPLLIRWAVTPGTCGSDSMDVIRTDAGAPAIGGWQAGRQAGNPDDAGPQASAAAVAIVAIVRNPTTLTPTSTTTLTTTTTITTPTLLRRDVTTTIIGRHAALLVGHLLYPMAFCSCPRW